MRSLRSWMVVALVAGAGCAMGQGDDDELSYEVGDGKADDGVVRPFGTWSRELAEAEAGFYALALTEGRRYHYAQRLVRCDPESCVDERSGRYRFAAHGDARYVVLFDDDTVWYSFEYQLVGDTLRLRYAGMGYSGDEGWFDMALASQAWCEMAEDCLGQRLASGCGAEAFQCVEGTCTADCGIDEERCSILEGAIDDGIGMSGFTLEECIEELGGEPIRQELEACCAADELYFFCSDL